ncbi:MAG: hypothetical protein PHU42_02005 [Patescibacteria group bacterium]|nr:hypothetical protein [Patescibacteria group bacterium]
MKNIKKLVYIYLALILLVYLFVPLTARAANFGSVNLVGATSAGINVGQSYSFQLAVNDGSPADFKIDNITEIDLYKKEGLSTQSGFGGQQLITSVTGLSSADKDVKARFENFSAVVVSGSQVSSVQIYAVINYLTLAFQPASFTTNSTTYQVGSVQTPTTGGSTLTPPPATTGGNTVVNPNLNSTQPTISLGNFSSYIIGGSCSAGIIACLSDRAIRLFIAVASIGSIFMIIWGGILLITSAGDTKKVATGRLAITGAIIGLIIVLLSYSIEQFVEKTFTGQSTGITSIGTGSGETTMAKSLSNTATVPGNVNYDVIYTRTGTLISAAQAKDNGSTCNTVTIEGKTLPCGGIRSGIKDYYPDVRGINLNSDGKMEVYYIKTAGSAQIFYDTWTPALSAPIIAPPPSTAGGTGQEGSSGSGGGTTALPNIQTISYKSGTYIGQLSGGVPNGQGKYEFAGQLIYDGQWRNGVISGQGIYYGKGTNTKLQNFVQAASNNSYGTSVAFENPICEARGGGTYESDPDAWGIPRDLKNIIANPAIGSAYSIFSQCYLKKIDGLQLLYGAGTGFTPFSKIIQAHRTCGVLKGIIESDFEQTGNFNEGGIFQGGQQIGTWEPLGYDIQPQYIKTYYSMPNKKPDGSFQYILLEKDWSYNNDCCGSYFLSKWAYVKIFSNDNEKNAYRMTNCSGLPY